MQTQRKSGGQAAKAEPHGKFRQAEDVRVAERNMLCLAAGCGWLPSVKAYLERGLDADARNWFGYAPLICAARWNSPANLETALHLLKMGADVNARGKRDGLTPLHKAVRNRATGMVGLLLGHGADWRIKDTLGRTAYDHADRNMRLKLEELGVKY